jgi:hypothetical protein
MLKSGYACPNYWKFGSPGVTLEWLRAQGTLAIRHLQKICGEPPPEMELEIVWQEHDFGTYPTIALTWEDGMRGAPWPYIFKMPDRTGCV